MAIPELDISKSIVTTDGKPTQYFEELWFLLSVEINRLQAQQIATQAELDALEVIVTALQAQQVATQAQLDALQIKVDTEHP